MTHSGAAGANRPNLTFCSVADMSLKMERHRQRTQPFWKSPLHVLGIVICLCLGYRLSSRSRVRIAAVGLITHGRPADSFGLSERCLLAMPPGLVRVQPEVRIRTPR